MEELFDIEYWLPFGGGQYHCTIAVGVTQSYVDKVKEQYEKDLSAWQTGPHFLPFFHSLKIEPHTFMPRDNSFIKAKEHSKQIEEAKRQAREEGIIQGLNSASHFVTQRQKLNELKELIDKKTKDVNRNIR